MLSRIPRTSNTTLITGPNILSTSQRITPYCIILDNWVCENYILADEPFAKALWSPESCVLVNNHLLGKLVSSLQLLTLFDKRFKVTSVPFFIPDFNLSSCQLDSFKFEVLYCVILC